MHYSDLHHLSTLPRDDFEYIIFDKDGTLTPHNRPIEDKYKAQFSQYIQANRVIILTARDFDACKSHLLDPIGDTAHKLILACSNGSEIFVFEDDNWKMVSKIEGTLSWQQNAINECINIMDHTFGLQQVTFEYRSDAMGAFALIPRDSTQSDRSKLDPNKILRKKIINTIRPLFPDEYEIIAAGQTSIDVSLVNKKVGMEHILQYCNITPNMAVYFGDSFDGGNDKPTLDIADLTTVAVKNAQHTFDIIT